MQLGIINVSGDYSITNDLDINVLIVDSSTLAITIDLPPAPDEGYFFYIKDNGNAGTNNITIDGNGKLIESDTTANITINYNYIELIYCSTNDKWFIL